MGLVDTRDVVRPETMVMVQGFTPFQYQEPNMKKMETGRQQMRAGLGARGTGRRSQPAGEYVQMQSQDNPKNLWMRLVRLILPRKRHSHKRENARRMRQVARGILKPNYDLWHKPKGTEDETMY
jgi:hypothetical protein